MAHFLAALSLYYACDALLLHKPMALTERERISCAAHYETVKLQFAEAPFPPQASPDGVAARHSAYRAFKAWELQNDVLVTRMREQAARAVRERG